MILKAMSEDCICCLWILDCGEREIVDRTNPFLDLRFDPSGEKFFFSDVASEIASAFDILEV